MGRIRKSKLAQKENIKLNKEIRRLKLLEHKFNVTYAGKFTLKYLALKSSIKEQIKNKNSYQISVIGVKTLNSHELVENRKMKVLLFGFIDMNSMDGSAVFLSSLASTIALDSNIEVDLLLASPVKRDILIQPLEKFDNITILNPFVDPFLKPTMMNG